MGRKFLQGPIPQTVGDTVYFNADQEDFWGRILVIVRKREEIEGPYDAFLDAHQGDGTLVFDYIALCERERKTEGLPGWVLRPFAGVASWLSSVLWPPDRGARF